MSQNADHAIVQQELQQRNGKCANDAAICQSFRPRNVRVMCRMRHEGGARLSLSLGMGRFERSFIVYKLSPCATWRSGSSLRFKREDEKGTLAN